MYQKIRTFARILRNCVLKKSMSKEKKIEKPGCLYWGFKAYLRFFHDKIYYKKTWNNFLYLHS